MAKDFVLYAQDLECVLASGLNLQLDGKFYVYEYFDTRLSKYYSCESDHSWFSSTFYVGKGSSTRLLHHLFQYQDWKSEGFTRKFKHLNFHKLSTIRNIFDSGNGLGIRVSISLDSDLGALSYEKFLISFYGRENLTNMTDGGEGLSGMTFSESHKKKLKESLKKAWTPEKREALRLKMIGFKHTEETKDKLRDIQSNRSLEINKKISEAAKIRCSDPDFLNKMSQNGKAQARDPVKYAKLLENMKKAREARRLNRLKKLTKDNE